MGTTSIEQQMETGVVLVEEIMLFRFLQAQIDKLSGQPGREATCHNYRSTLHALQRYRGGKDLPLSEVNAAFIEKLDAYFKAKKLKPNTSSFYMRVLRAIRNQAIELGLLEENEHNLFRKVYTGVETTQKRTIDPKVIQQIAACDLSEDPNLALARDLSIVAFLLCGIAFVDLAHLKKTDLNNNHLQYTRSKTGKVVKVKVLQEVLAIIERYQSLTVGSPYLFPILFAKATGLDYHSALRIQNNRLHRLSTLLNLVELLTTYVIRHAWASIANELGLPLGLISDSLGHTSQETTQIHTSTLSQRLQDEGTEKVARFVFKKITSTCLSED